MLEPIVSDEILSLGSLSTSWATKKEEHVWFWEQTMTAVIALDRLVITGDWAQPIRTFTKKYKVDSLASVILLAITKGKTFTSTLKSLRKSIYFLYEGQSFSSQNTSDSISPGCNKKYISYAHYCVIWLLLIQNMRLPKVRPPFPGSFSSTQIVLMRSPQSPPKWRYAPMDVAILG